MAQLVCDFVLLGGCVNRLRHGGLRRVLELQDLSVAPQEFALQAGEPGLVLLRFSVEGLGALAPVVDLFLREFLGAGFGDLEFFLQLRDFHALRFGDLFEMAGLAFPIYALGFDLFETMRKDIELLFELRLRRTFALQLLVQVQRARFRVAQRVL